jgi:hypothetical protein
MALSSFFPPPASRLCIAKQKSRSSPSFAGAAGPSPPQRESAPGPRAAAGRSSPGLTIAIEAAMGAARNRKREMIMATIGTFTKSETGFAGSVKTLTLNVKAKFTAAETENDKAPDYRVFAGATDYAE